MKTPPGTVPLMSNYLRPIHDLDDHPKGCKCFDDPPCKHIGFRVVDAEAFNEWKTGLAKPIQAR